jgi:DNA polymerase-3 subunit gamma/tau
VSYQVLARKYRPQTFEEVVGQAPIVSTLKNAVAQKRIHHAYLFSGLRGVGKTTVARLMAKALNCAQGPTATPCNACASCAEIAGSRSIDVLEIDGASNRGIESIRELRETVRYSPARDHHKVYIIDEVHMLTPEAWNALLKTLEEPPPHVVFLFATTDYRKIPLTILSRCQHFEFRKIAAPEMAGHLRKVAEGEKIAVPDPVITLIVRAAEGSLRDAQSALDQVIAFSGETITEEQARAVLGVIDADLIAGFFAAVRAGDCARLVGIVDTVFENGYQAVQFLEDLMAYGRDLLLVRALPEAGRHLPGGADQARDLQPAAAAFGEDEMLRILELLTREEQRLKSTSNPRVLLEALAIRLARLADLTPIEDLIARLEKGGGAPAPGNGPAPGQGAGPARRPGAALSMSPAGGAAAASPAATAITAPDFEGSDAGGPAQVEAILQRVQDERGALGGILAQAAWVEIADGALLIAFDDKHTFFREKIESRDTADYLKNVAREVAGRNLLVRPVSTASMTRPAAAPAAGTPALSSTGSTGARAAAAAPRAAPGPAPAPAVEPAAPVTAPAGAGAAAPGAPAAAPVPANRATRGTALPEERRRQLQDEALREPLVKSVLETFGAQIVDVDQA